MAIPALLQELQAQLRAIATQQTTVITDSTHASGDPANGWATAVIGWLKPVCNISGYGMAVWNGASWVQVTGAGGGVTPGGAAGGDLTGLYPNPTIGTKKIQAAKIDSGAALISQALVADGAGGAAWGAAASGKSFSFFMG